MKNQTNAFSLKSEAKTFLQVIIIQYAVEIFIFKTSCSEI